MSTLCGWLSRFSFRVSLKCAEVMISNMASMFWIWLACLVPCVKVCGVFGIQYSSSSRVR